MVGESYRQANLWKIVGREPCNDRIQHRCHAVLVAETDNEYDANAISVWVEGLQVGFLSREDAADYRSGLVRLTENGVVSLAATIVGGGHGGAPLLGIFLDHDPTDGRRSDRLRISREPPHVHRQHHRGVRILRERAAKSAQIKAESH